MQDPKYRSGCPISLALDVFGDRWSLLIIRDLMFAGKRRFREILQSDERISSNILSDRLSMLVEQGIVVRDDDPTHKQKAIYRLTEKGIDLLPILLQMSTWSRKHMPVDPKLAAFATRLAKTGVDALRAQLEEDHLGARTPARRGP